MRLMALRGGMLGCLVVGVIGTAHPLAGQLPLRGEVGASLLSYERGDEEAYLGGTLAVGWIVPGGTILRGSLAYWPSLHPGRRDGGASATLEHVIPARGYDRSGPLVVMGVGYFHDENPVAYTVGHGTTWLVGAGVHVSLWRGVGAEFIGSVRRDLTGIDAELRGSATYQPRLPRSSEPVAGSLYVGAVGMLNGTYSAVGPSFGIEVVRGCGSCLRLHSRFEVWHVRQQPSGGIGGLDTRVFPFAIGIEGTLIRGRSSSLAGALAFRPITVPEGLDKGMRPGAVARLRWHWRIGRGIVAGLIGEAGFVNWESSGTQTTIGFGATFGMGVQ